MDNISRINRNIKKIVSSSIDNMKLTDISFGTVTSSNPLIIILDQKLELNINQLILSRNVTDFKTKLTVPGTSYDNREVIIHNSLKEGEKVIMLRLLGGQKYLVLDRIGDI